MKHLILSVVLSLFFGSTLLAQNFKTMEDVMEEANEYARSPLDQKGLELNEDDASTFVKTASKQANLVEYLFVHRSMFLFAMKDIESKGLGYSKYDAMTFAHKVASSKDGFRYSIQMRIAYLTATTILDLNQESEPESSTEFAHRFAKMKNGSKAIGIYIEAFYDFILTEGNIEKDAEAMEYAEKKVAEWTKKQSEQNDGM